MNTQPPSLSPSRLRGRRLAVPLVAALLVSGACGNRLSHDEIVAAANHVVTEPSNVPLPGGTPVAGVAATTDAPAAPTSASPAGPSGSPTPRPAASPAPGARAVGATPTVAAGGAAPAKGGPANPTGGPAAPAPSASRNAVVIGHIGTYSGILGGLMAGGLQTAQVWAKSVNAGGGLNGHPVQLLTADDGGDPARYLAITKDMVENRGAIAFVGNMAPLSVSGGVNYLQQKGVPVVGGDLTDPIWHESPILFAQGTWIVHLVTAAARIAVKDGHKRLGIIYCAEAPSCQGGARAWEDSVRKAGGQSVYKSQVSLAQPDFTAECLQARNAGVEAFFLGVDDASTPTGHPFLRPAGVPSPVADGEHRGDEPSGVHRRSRRHRRPAGHIPVDGHRHPGGAGVPPSHGDLR